MSVAELVAVDGEAIAGAYAILCSSEAPPLVRPAGIRTTEALAYLLALAAPNRVLVCFGLNYDANQWLSDLPEPYLHELWASKVVVWRGFRVEWVPGRYFQVTRAGTSVRVVEHFGFHQSSFVDACERWGVAVPDHVRVGKEDRPSFVRRDIPRVVRYCQAEVAALAELVRRVADATVDAGVEPYRWRFWFSSGSSASALMGRHGVGDHYAPDDALTRSSAAREAIMTAYLGARTELFRQGKTAGVRTADLRGAYPAATRGLPSLAGATLVHRKRFDPAVEHGIWRVSWSGIEGQVMPLAVRREHALWWPRSGSGWYHACEVAAVLRARFPVTVGEGYALRAPQVDARPFAWVDETYRLRKALEDAGSAGAARMLKMGMAALYGKMAQSQSTAFRRLPRWQSYFWAGEVTARTRARILGALLSVNRPVLVATDGIQAGGIGDVRASAGLGGWSTGAFDEVTAFKAGVYSASIGHDETIKSSGFFARDIDYDALWDGLRSDGLDAVYGYQSRRFMGLGVSLARDELEHWRAWRVESRKIFLRPTRKLATPLGDGVFVLEPVAVTPGGGSSDPYVPRGVGVADSPDAEDSEQGMDQPLRSEV